MNANSRCDHLWFLSLLNTKYCISHGKPHTQIQNQNCCWKKNCFVTTLVRSTCASGGLSDEFPVYLSRSPTCNFQSDSSDDLDPVAGGGPSWAAIAHATAQRFIRCQRA